MYQELKRLREELQSKKPYSREIAEQLKALNTLDYTCCGMVLDSDGLSREDIIGMLDGEMPKTVSLKQCMMVRNYADLMETIRHCLELRSSLDTKLLLKFYSILTGKAEGFRRSNYMAVELKHVPPHHSEVEASLNKLLRAVYSDDTNIIRNAALIHCGVLAAYPFEEDSGFMARVAMNYYLQEKGFEPVALGFSYEEYINTMTECLKDDNAALLYWVLERAEFNKLTQVMQIIDSEE